MGGKFVFKILCSRNTKKIHWILISRKVSHNACIASIIMYSYLSQLLSLLWIAVPCKNSCIHILRSCHVLFVKVVGSGNTYIEYYNVIDQLKIMKFQETDSFDSSKTKCAKIYRKSGVCISSLETYLTTSIRSVLHKNLTCQSCTDMKYIYMKNLFILLKLLRRKRKAWFKKNNIHWKKVEHVFKRSFTQRYWTSRWCYQSSRSL